MSYYCGLCDRWFQSYEGLGQHIENSAKHRTYECDDCGKQYASEQALINHYIQSPLHAYCRMCDEHFDDTDDLEEHYEDEHYYCEPCEEVFNSDGALRRHYSQCHYYCESCNRLFANQQSLDMHLNTSVIHNPRAYKCPGKLCQRSFVSYGDMALHCESGACRSGINRKAVNKLAIRYDEHNVITNPARLIGGPSGQKKTEVIGVRATAASWNGQAYECVLCHKTFRTLLALNSHLQSPVHDTKIYRCPGAYHGCNAEYKTLSALLHHVERGGCGVTRFRKQVTDALNEITSKMKRIGFR